MEFEIFKTGTHTSDNGVTRSFSASDLDLIVNSYNPSIHEAPIVIGHPKDNSPAFGWIDSLKRVGDTIVASAKNFVPEFLDALKSGLYKKRSISLNPDGTLNHVGFLGAAAPAVKGLKDISFSDSSFDSFGFDDFDISCFNSPIKKFSILDEIKRLLSSRNNPDAPPDNSSSQVATDDFQQVTASLINQVNSLDYKLNRINFETFLDSKIADGFLTPSLKTNFLSLLDFVSVTNFTDDTFSYQSFVESVKNQITSIVESLPKLIDFNSLSFKDDSNSAQDKYSEFNVDSESYQLHKKALVLSKNENISYTSAIQKLINRN